MFYGYLLKWDIKSLNFVMLLRTKYSSEVRHFSQQMTLQGWEKVIKNLGRDPKSSWNYLIIFKINY